MSTLPGAPFPARRNIEWTAEGCDEAGDLRFVEHALLENDIRAAAALLLKWEPVVAYVDIAEKWEEPRGAYRNPANIPVRYRYVARLFADGGEQALATTDDNRAIPAEIVS